MTSSHELVFLHMENQNDISVYFGRYKKACNALYFSAVLNAFCALYLLIDGKQMFNLGFSLSILQHQGWMHWIQDDFFARMLASFSGLLLSVPFFYIATFVKKGRFKALVLFFVLYGLDTILLFFLPSRFFEESQWFLLSCYFVHIVVLVYLFLLLRQFLKINRMYRDKHATEVKKQ